MNELYAALSPWAWLLLRATAGLVLLPHALQKIFGFFPESKVPSSLGELAASLESTRGAVRSYEEFLAMQHARALRWKDAAEPAVKAWAASVTKGMERELARHPRHDEGDRRHVGT